MYFKPLLLAAVCALPAVMAGELKIDLDASSGDTNAAPEHALFACVVKSTTCKSTSHFTSAVLTPPELTLDVCHHDGAIKNLFNRLMPTHGRGAFINTFYVACATKDGKECDDCKRYKANDVRDALSEAFDGQTKCDASVRCYDLNSVDDKCFPK